MTFCKRLSKSGTKSQSTVDVSGVTASCISEFEEETCDFLWTINSHTFCKPEAIYSAIFSNKPGSFKRWRIELFHKKNNNQDDEISLYLKDKSSNAEKEELCNSNMKDRPDVRFEMSLVNIHGKKKHTKSSLVATRNLKTNSWGFENFITSSTLFDPKNELLQNNNGNGNDGNGPTFTVYVQVWIMGQLKHKIVKDSGRLGAGVDVTITQEIDLLRLLSENMKLTLENSTLPDVTISTKFKKMIPAHRSILAARSPIFEEELKAKSKKKNITIHLEDFEHDVVKSFLEYIYTGKITKDVQKKAKDILILASKYKVEKLKDECEKIIAAGLTLENALDIYIYAYSNELPDLKSSAISFINKHKTEIRDSEKFEEMKESHPDELIEIVMHLK